MRFFQPPIVQLLRPRWVAPILMGLWLVPSPSIANPDCDVPVIHSHEDLVSYVLVCNGQQQALHEHHLLQQEAIELKAMIERDACELKRLGNQGTQTRTERKAQLALRDQFAQLMAAAGVVFETDLFKREGQYE